MREMPFPQVPGAVSLAFTTDLAAVRALVRRRAQEAGLSEERAIDLVIAVGEVAANTVQHARTAGTIDIWSDTEEIVCQISDAGHINDPLAGSRAPEPGATTGYGLWMVNQVCDEVDLHSSESGTTIRMHMRIKDLPPVQHQHGDIVRGRRVAHQRAHDRGTGRLGQRTLLPRFR
jgi:anti-sigma regulatory factor (Ser/Thr protein kinase)